LDEQNKTLFYDKITAYVRFYSFISQVIPYTDQQHEKLYGFGRNLIPHLKIGDGWINPHPENNVDLFYYRIEKEATVSMVMEDCEPYGVKSPTDVGTGKAKDEEKPLSEIIRTLNVRFGTDFSEADRLLFEQLKETACRDDRIIKTALANTLDKFELGIEKMMQDLMMLRMVDNDNIVTRYMEDREFQKVVFQILAREIYRGVRANQK
jgi:type I restriction enzyme R subunit